MPARCGSPVCGGHELRAVGGADAPPPAECRGLMKPLLMVSGLCRAGLVIRVLLSSGGCLSNRKLLLAGMVYWSPSLYGGLLLTPSRAARVLARN